jgi:acetate kinase
MDKFDTMDLLENALVKAAHHAINKVCEGKNEFTEAQARELVGRVGVRIVFGKETYAAAFK